MSQPGYGKPSNLPPPPQKPLEAKLSDLVHHMAEAARTQQETNELLRELIARKK